MGFLSTIKRKARALSTSTNHHDDNNHVASTADTVPIDATTTTRDNNASLLQPQSQPLHASVAFAYTGVDPFGVTFQRARAKFVDADGPTRVEWHKHERLGITFSEKSDSGVIAIKSIDDAMSTTSTAHVSIGQELIGVNNQPVAGLDFRTVMALLQAAHSPCLLDFTPPPSPIVVAHVDETSTAFAHGVIAGMVLHAVDSVSMIGATLQNVHDAVLQATIDEPAVLEFVLPHTAAGMRALTRSDSSEKTHRRHLAGFAAVAAVLAV